MTIRPCKQCGQPFDGRTTAAYCSVHCFKENERAYSRRIRKTWSQARKLATSRTSDAICRRKLIPQPCEVCGEKHAFAHHDDYAKSLEVRWLCRKHHAQHHRNHGPGANA